MDLPIQNNQDTGLPFERLRLILVYMARVIRVQYLRCHSRIPLLPTLWLGHRRSRSGNDAGNPPWALYQTNALFISVTQISRRPWRPAQRLLICYLRNNHSMKTGGPAIPGRGTHPSPFTTSLGLEQEKHQILTQQGQDLEVR